MYRQILDTLYKRGFYNQLYFDYKYMDIVAEIKEIVTLNSLTKLGLMEIGTETIVTLSGVVNLQKLYIDDSESVSNWEDMPVEFNVDLICFGRARFHTIINLIRQAEQLNHIVVNTFTHFDSIEAINENIIVLLAAINEERQQLTDPHKVTVYVDEERVT